MRAVHRTRCRPLEVHAFAVISAAMAGALELVLARLPVGRATQVRAAGVNHKNAIRGLVHPDAKTLLPLGIHAKPIIFGIADLEAGSRLKQCTRQKETEKRQEPR